MDAKWLLGGVCVAAGVSFLLYRLSDDGKEAGQAQSLSREQLLTVLRDIKKETSSVLIMLASYAQSVREQVGDKIDDASIKEILTAQSPMKDMMTRAETKVYEKHGISKEQVKQGYFSDFKDDQEVQRISREMQEASNNAFKGIAPQCEARLPDFLTPDVVIDLMKAMYDATARVTYRKFSELRKQGIQMSPYDPRFMAATQSMESEVEEEKEQVYQRFGLSNLDDPAPLVLNMAVQRYSTNMRFATQIARIESEYKMKMQGMMMGKMDGGEFMGEEGNEEGERVMRAVESAMVGQQERILEEELKSVGRGRPAKVEEIQEEGESVPVTPTTMKVEVEGGESKSEPMSPSADKAAS